jgi:hypothetical protein
VNDLRALPETDESLREAVYTAVGAASACWENMFTDKRNPDGTRIETNAGVFQDDRAREVAEDLLMRIKVLTGLGEPHLGLATNAQLREELKAREETGNVEDDYRTLEPDKALWHLVEEPWVGKEALWQHRDFPNIYSTDRGKTWYNLDEPLDFEGNPKIYKMGEYIA